VEWKQEARNAGKEGGIFPFLPSCLPALLLCFFANQPDKHGVFRAYPVACQEDK
jgi:hypothetical protein